MSTIITHSEAKETWRALKQEIIQYTSEAQAIIEILDTYFAQEMKRGRPKGSKDSRARNMST